MPKITDNTAYSPVTEIKEGDKLLGVQEGAVRQFPANLVGGGGEQWDDITDLFEEDYNNSYGHYIHSKFGRDDVNAKGTFRIYLETLNNAPGLASFVGNTRVFMFTIDFNSLNAGYILNFSTSTIYEEGVDVYVGRIVITSHASTRLEIAYNYGVEDPGVDSTRPPKIFKIERLVE